MPDGEAAGVVGVGAGAGGLFGDPVGLTGGFTEDGGPGDGEVAAGVGEAGADAGGLAGEVPVGLGAVEVRDVGEHAPSRRTAQTPSIGHANRGGRPGRRRCGLLRPSPGIAHLTVHRSTSRQGFDAAIWQRSSTNPGGYRLCARSSTESRCTSLKKVLS
ncbi:MAG TPA: hypothetical protein VGK51_07770, partial [Actinomycetota bacterium]